MAQSYCSLMEAYNVPSFDPPRRKKGCVVDPSDIKASSVPFEPYQDSSKEQAMWANGVGGGSKVARARANAPLANSIENFEGLDGAGAGASGRSPPMPNTTVDTNKTRISTAKHITFAQRPLRPPGPTMPS